MKLKNISKVLILIVILTIYYCKKDPEPTIPTQPTTITPTTSGTGITQPQTTSGNLRALLTGNNLLALTINDGIKNMVGIISANTITFNEQAAHGTTQVTVQAIVTSSGATLNVSINDRIPISGNIIVTAENGDTKNYSITINIVPCDLMYIANNTLMFAPFQRIPCQDFNTLSTAGNDKPYGIWSDGTTMWVSDYDDAKIYAYNLATKVRDTSKDFNTLDAAGNDKPYGIWSDGTTMWVSDYDDAKIYAYNLATKARDASKGFNTLYAAENLRPRGIWSDGTIMWVAYEGRIYAYRMPY